MALYVILGLSFIALYFIIRSDAKAEIKADIAEAKAKEISKITKAANEIDISVKSSDDTALDNGLSEFTKH